MIRVVAWLPQRLKSMFFRHFCFPPLHSKKCQKCLFIVFEAKQCDFSKLHFLRILAYCNMYYIMRRKKMHSKYRMISTSSLNITPLVRDMKLVAFFPSSSRITPWLNNRAWRRRKKEEDLDSEKSEQCAAHIHRSWRWGEQKNLNYTMEFSFRPKDKRMFVVKRMNF